ncbi:U2 small nuclear ribonucleoprotein auxiliary factor 35 kDa subunit-related protein 1 isoform X2 [Orussus abietinus]|uniref:U2 small nuclear ribonucleoprotein auxiliary factor 35 kDa subunit-related protein 1 isoform X2 n=1 Tax=Orussus abietinus TaxID=222816 RepID=UPI0006253C3B|nr:U2 small nuclear ribonucleoprotein auxiliary factor 35 kDa subunit-related protein 1 isoform X2 [Orussus abietinus]
MWLPKPADYFVVKAQEEWRVQQERKARARQEQLQQEAKIRQEFEEKQKAQRAKKEEEQRLRDAEFERQRDLQRRIDEYIDEGASTPETFRVVTDSQPGRELCPFFTKTGACRYGDTCSRNHRRVCLSKVILVPGFYSHFSLEKNSAEYDTDVGLEFESSETRRHFREFYKDVVPELESFGRIRTLKYCCNTEIHLRGNLYVEYYTEREAARALRKLKGRWYAGRQLNCEFVNLKSWRNAVCGMGKCPKGRACNFLHTFRNPRDEYDIKSPPMWAKRAGSQDPSASSRRSSSRRQSSKWEESVRGENESGSWRWSESPEPEIRERRRRKDSRDEEQPRKKRTSASRSSRSSQDSSRRRTKPGRSEEDGTRPAGRSEKSGSENRKERSTGARKNGGMESSREGRGSSRKSRIPESSSSSRRSIASESDSSKTKRTSRKRKRGVSAWDTNEKSVASGSESGESSSSGSSGAENPEDAAKDKPPSNGNWDTSDCDEEPQKTRR